MSEAAGDAAPPRTFAENLFGLFHEAERSFAALLPAARYWPPLLLLLGLNAAFTAVWMSKVDPLEFFRAELEWSGQADRIAPEQQAAILEAQARVFPVFGWLGGLLGAPLMVLVGAAVYALVFRFFLGSEIPFRQILTIVSWAMLALAVVTLPLALAVMGLRGDWSINPGRALQANLALALDRATAPRPLYALLDSLDLFTLFALYLIYAGFRVGTGLKPATVAAGVLAPWALYVMAKMGLAALWM
jgi:hypothetical protein